jgi:predicted dehydrogenase
MKTIRAASVGLGWWGNVLAEAAARSGAVDVVRCYARTPETRTKFADQHGCTPVESLDTLLEDEEVDALLIATPHSTHRGLIEAAADAGKHVFVEKPLTLTVEDGKAAVAAARTGGIVLQVGHHRRRQPAIRRLRELVDAEQLGMIHLVESSYFVPKWQQPPTTWRASIDESPVGGMTGLGVHTVDTFHYLVGPVARVMAYSKPLLGRSPLDDISVIAFEFESGCLGYLGTSLVLPFRCDVSVIGTEAAAWSEEDGTRLFHQAKDERTRREEGVPAFDELADELAEFGRCVSEGQRPETGGPEALEVVVVLEAIVEAVRSGRSVEVADLR